MTTADELPFPDGPVGERLRGVLDELLSRGQAELPPFAGVPGIHVAQWLYRTWLLNQRAYRPLLHVEPKHVAGTQHFSPEWWSVARGGWIYFEAPVHHERPASLQAAVASKALFLLCQGEGAPLSATPEWTRTLLRRAPFHNVAVDPSLAHLRRSLLSHCRSASPVHLRGEPGTDKVLLARWAHATVDDRALSWIRGNQGQPRPGEWPLFEDVDELGQEQRHHLEEKLASFEQPAPVFLPASPQGTRPRHPLLESIIGESAALTAVLEQVLLLAPRPLAVLILGEPGVGKEAIARALHTLSGRSGPFVALDMGAVQESLAESELFGHRRGAFTGADRVRRGAIRAAEGGTLFLDEIGNTSPALQVKLVRAMQEKMVQPLGEDEPVAVDVRIIAATNADIDSMVRRGGFRADLLDRLSAARIAMPPLRERLEDLDALARHFLTQALGAPPKEPWCTHATRAILLGHRWPGNIRELGNILRYAAVMSPAGAPLSEEHLGPLSPYHSRRVPVLTTTNNSATDGGWGLDRRLVQTMTAVTFAVPPLRDRDIDGRQCALLDALGGRPIHPAALRLLADWPWWGNHIELKNRLSALSALPPGGIDLDMIKAHFPHLAQEAGHAPIRVLLSPVAGAGGRVEGLVRDLPVAALLLGRIRRMDDLRALAQTGDARVRSWLEFIAETCHPAEPTCLDFGPLSRLSRAHVLITRAHDGLLAHALPNVGLPVVAGSLSPGATIQKLVPGQPMPLGRGGEIRVLGSASNTYLQFFLFLGVVAFEDLADKALERSEAGQRAAPPTLQHTDAEPSTDDTRASSGLRVWQLNAKEQEVLNDLVLAFQGGQLKAHVAQWANVLPGRLSDYLLRAPRLSQYLVRLYEYPPNVNLRRHLAARIAKEPDAEERKALLPEGFRRCLTMD